MPICFELKGVEKTYDGQPKPALSIPGELRIPAGEMIGIVGASGSGKSTLLNLLSLLDRPSKGEIIYHCQRTNESSHYSKPLSDREQNRLRRENFGFVFQSGHLLNHFSCIDNVFLPLSLNDRPKSEKLKTARALLSAMGLSDKERTMPRKLSGGEYQRIAVIRALAHNPEVVFADEPTGNLDPPNGRRVIDLLSNWCRDTDSHRAIHNQTRNTLLLVTHNIPQAVRICNRLLVFHGGRVIDQYETANHSREALIREINRVMDDS